MQPGEQLKLEIMTNEDVTAEEQLAQEQYIDPCTLDRQLRQLLIQRAPV